MTKRDILSIAFKILGVILIIQIHAVIFTPGNGTAIRMLSQLSNSDINPYWFLVEWIVSIILLLIMVCTLFRWGDAIAKKLIKKDEQDLIRYWTSNKAGFILQDYTDYKAIGAPKTAHKFMYDAFLKDWNEIL